MSQYLQEVHIQNTCNHVIVLSHVGDVTGASSKSSYAPSVGSFSGDGCYDELGGISLSLSHTHTHTHVLSHTHTHTHTFSLKYLNTFKDVWIFSKSIDLMKFS